MFPNKSTNAIADEEQLVAGIEKVRIEANLEKEKLMLSEEDKGITVHNKLQSDSSESGLTREKSKSIVKRLNKNDQKQKLLNRILKAARSIERLVLKLEELELDSSDSEDDSTSDIITESGCSSHKRKPTIEQANKKKQKEPKMKIKEKPIKNNEGMGENNHAIIEHEVALATRVDASIAEETIEVLNNDEKSQDGEKCQEA